MSDRPNKLVDGDLVPLTDAEWDAFKATQSGPQPALAAVIYKADIFRRATEDEAEAITGALSQASARLQGIFAGAQLLSTDDPDFPMIRAGLVAAVGATRADELLAPST